MSGSIIISIPPNIQRNPAWFNNYIAAIFYSQYSNELLKKNNINGNTLNDYIFDEYKDIDISELKKIKIKNIINDVFSIKLTAMLKHIKIDYNLYEYYLSNRKIFTSFILPKFIYYLGLDCISIEHYNKKNYVGLYNLVKYVSHKKVIKKQTLFGFGGKEEIKEEFKLELDTTKKQNFIRKIYDKKNNPEYITINKWFDSNIKNIPNVLLDIEKMNSNTDDDDIDNLYRLSTTYKSDKDLKITDNIDEEIIYNGYIYKLDSCIINNYNNDYINEFIDEPIDNEENKIKEPVVCLTNNDNGIIYSGLHVPNTLCENVYNFDWFNKNKFDIYTEYPCNIFEGEPFGIPDEKISKFNMKKSNYTLIYVKYENIDEKKKENDEKKKKENDEKKKKEKEEKEKEEKEKKEKEEKEKREKKEREERDAKMKAEKERLDNLIKETNKEDIEEIQKIITFSVNKDDFNNLKKILNEYIKLLKYDESELKRYSFENCVKKILDIQDELTINHQRYDTIAAKPGNKTLPERLFLGFYDNIKVYLNKYIYHIINFLARQNTIYLLKEELKDLPNNAKITQILDTISKLPNNESIKKIEDLLSPNDAKITQILDTIEKLPNDEKLKRKLDELLSPTDAKITQILAAIEKLPNDDKTKVILDEIAKIPKEDKTKVILDEIAKLPNEAKINELLAKIPKEDKTKIITDEIAKLPNNAKITELLNAIKELPKADNKKIVDDLNVKIDTMQQVLLSKLQEQRDVGRSRNNATLQPEIDELKQQLQLLGNVQKELTETSKQDNKRIVDDLNVKLDNMQQVLLDKLQEHINSSKSSSSSRNNITLQSEISSLNQQLQLLEAIQVKLSNNGDRDNKQLLADMQKELAKYSKKDNELIIKGVQDLFRSFNEEIITKQNEKDIKVHKEIEGNVKEQLLLLKDIQSKLEKEHKSSSKKENKENDLLKLENAELKKQIEILNDIKDKCHKQQKEYDRCNKHNMLPYKYIKFKEEELLDAIKEHFKSEKKPSDKIIIDFIFKYFEKNNKVMNIYLIEKYMGDIYDVMKIFNKKYNIEEVDIKQFYRLLASISIYAKFHDNIKKIFIK
jgi:hypothetical protein